MAEDGSGLLYLKNIAFIFGYFLSTTHTYVSLFLVFCNYLLLNILEKNLGAYFSCGNSGCCVSASIAFHSDFADVGLKSLSNSFYDFSFVFLPA